MSDTESTVSISDSESSDDNMDGVPYEGFEPRTSSVISRPVEPMGAFHFNDPGAPFRRQVAAARNVVPDIRSRSWTWTYYDVNLTEDVNPLQVRAVFGISPTYLVFQLERAPETGRLHLQGYVHYPTLKTLRQLVQLLPGVHAEKAEGTPLQNKAYCTKEETRVCGPWEYGECPQQGKRSDLVEVAQKVLNGMPLKRVAVEHPEMIAKYAKGLTMLSTYAPAPAWRDEDKMITLSIGPAGSGKTYAALSEYNDAYIKEEGTWWDNYVGQEAVVLDDFCGRASSIPLAKILRVLDVYRCQVPVKGAFQWLTAKAMIITSNMHPTQWYDWKGRAEMYKALTRRIDRVVVFKQDHSFEVLNEEQKDMFFEYPSSWGFNATLVPNAGE